MSRFLTIQITGVPEVLAGLEASKRMLRNAYRNTLTEIGRLIRDEVRAAAPVLTGALRASIKFKTDRGAVDLITGRVYADTSGKGRSGRGLPLLFVEYGTAHATAQPFFTQIVEKWNAKIPQIFDAVYQHKVEEQLAKALK